MEDLQDVLEDVTYMNAMSDDSPKPTKAWDMPDEASLQEFCARELAADPEAFALDRVCQTSLGFYLFCRYCREAGGEVDAAQARFLEDVVRYKRTIGDKGKALQAVKMARRYLTPRPDPKQQRLPSTIHEDGGLGLGPFPWEAAEEDELQQPSAKAAVDINEGDLRRLPNSSLSRAELISCYQDAVQDAQRRLQEAARQQHLQQQQQRQSGGPEQREREKVVSTASTASTQSPSYGSSQAALPSPGVGVGLGGGGSSGGVGGVGGGGEGVVAGALTLSPRQYLNALGLGGHVLREALEVVRQVAVPMVHEYLATDHRYPLQPQSQQGQGGGGGGGGHGAAPSQHQHQHQHQQRGRHGGRQRAAQGPGGQPVSPQRGLGGWRPGPPGRGGVGGPKQGTPPPVRTAMGTGVAAPGGLTPAKPVSAASKGSVMRGGDDSLVEEGISLGSSVPPTPTGTHGRSDTPIALPGAAMPPPLPPSAGASSTVGATATTAAAAAGSSRTPGAGPGTGTGGGATEGPLAPGGGSSTMSNTSKEHPSLHQVHPGGGAGLPAGSPATPPPWQQEEEVGAGEADGEGFFGRMRQRLSASLFDKLELLVWEALASRHGPGFLGGGGAASGALSSVSAPSSSLSSAPSSSPSPLFKKYQQFAFLARKPVTEEDFVLFRVLGRGGFGQVNGCKRCQTGKLYAMKVMNKRRVKAHQSEKLCWNERKILSLVDSPFVVCLKYAFTSKEDLFLILDLMRGGDLAFHLDKRGRFTMDEARYFAARTLLGLSHLHKNGIVYRDLKPDNILMDERGKTRISDLGLACKVTPDLVGTYGTRGYWAPEMLMKDAKGHRLRYSQCVDWFSFGCVVYEMIIGFSPFRSERIYEWSGLTKKDKHKAIDMAVIGMEPEFDRRYFDEDAIDLCKKLLEKDPRKRLGAKGSADVMAHPWFLKGGIEWDVFVADAADPPFVPNQDINAASQSAIGSFNDENQYRKMKIDESDHEVYTGWEWASQSAFFAEVVQFLKAEELQGPIVPAQSAEGCCAVS